MDLYFAQQCFGSYQVKVSTSDWASERVVVLCGARKEHTDDTARTASRRHAGCVADVPRAEALNR